eukprot:COSAG02_NODE_7521_length_2975_cov_1.688804_2_plen_79_part_00
MYVIVYILAIKPFEFASFASLLLCMTDFVLQCTFYTPELYERENASSIIDSSCLIPPCTTIESSAVFAVSAGSQIDSL